MYVDEIGVDESNIAEYAVFDTNIFRQAVIIEVEFGVCVRVRGSTGSRKRVLGFVWGGAVFSSPVVVAPFMDQVWVDRELPTFYGPLLLLLSNPFVAIEAAVHSRGEVSVSMYVAHGRLQLGRERGWKRWA